MSFPSTSATVALFVAYLTHKQLGPKTILTYLSAVGYVHKMLSLSDPTQSYLIQKLVHGAFRLRPSADVRLPITVPILNKLIDAADHVANVIYDRVLIQAMFLFAFSCFARIGELTYTSADTTQNILQLSDVATEIPAGSTQASSISVTFRMFKHNTKGSPKTITFSHGPTQLSGVAALIRYLQVRPRSPGPLFCLADGSHVTRSYFDKFLHKCLSFCRLDSSRYKGHSFRIGAATHAANRGVSDGSIKMMGRWNSDAFKKYIRPNNTL